MSKQVTRKQAETVLTAVREFTGKDAALYEPGFHTSGWAIALEGMYDWPQAFTAADYAETLVTDDTVFIEPVNGWALGIYPA